VFLGFDPRQPVSYNVAQFSILRRAHRPVWLCPLIAEQLDFQRPGLTPFTWTRFLVPWLCNFQGWAVFMDADVIVVDDIYNIMNGVDQNKAVHVCDTNPAFERGAVMLFNCAHPDNAILTREYVAMANNLHSIGWTKNIGKLDPRWNHLVGYDKPTDEVSLIHYTMGVPAFEETRDCEHADLWIQEAQIMEYAAPWQEIMGPSVHAVEHQGKMVPRYKANGDHRPHQPA
jgi:hypothetical protein